MNKYTSTLTDGLVDELFGPTKLAQGSEDSEVSN